MKRLLHHFDRIDPEARRIAAGWVLLVSLVGWPLSQLTLARHEPPFVLALSWLALIFTALDIVCSTDARKALDDQEDP